MMLATTLHVHEVHSLLDVLRHALMITAFVFTMMLVIEYLNVLTRGAWQQKLAANRWGQYVVAAVLGATPGCLGAFAVVAMYAHRTVTIGAVVTAMIATAGDETYWMLALIPRTGLLILGIMFVLSIPVGWVTDVLLRHRRTAPREGEILFEVHAHEECFAHGKIVHQWRECTPARGILATVLLILIVAVATAQIGPHEWNWIRITLLAVGAVALLIVATVPDHFLDEHLWRHVARKHALQIFLWTLGAMLVLYVLLAHVDLEHAIEEQHLKWVVFGVACLMGLIPESGPHLILVFLFADGKLPFSILLANSIIQDGHGMLPLLAHSRRAFLGVKAINFVVGALVGAVLLAIGL